jgi:hypothetical protein
MVLSQKESSIVILSLYYTAKHSGPIGGFHAVLLWVYDVTAWIKKQPNDHTIIRVINVILFSLHMYNKILSSTIKE